jgi:hypothetical protein
MDNRCKTIEPLIVDYALGELEGDQARLVEEHISSCSRCSEALEEVQRLLSALMVRGMVEPSAAVCESVREAVRQKLPGGRRRFSTVLVPARFVVRRPALTAATTLVAVAAIAVFIVLPAIRPTDSGEDVTRSIKADIVTLKKFEDYVSESVELMERIGGPDAADLLASHDWKEWVAAAMTMKEMEGFRRYHPLFQDMERVYRRIEECGGVFGEQQVAQIRKTISEEGLIARMKKALSSQDRLPGRK